MKFIIVFLLNLRKGDHVKKDKKIITNKRRSFIKKAGLLTLGAAGATTIKAPYAYSASNPIKWRLQTYSGAPLGLSLIHI